MLKSVRWRSKNTLLSIDDNKVVGIDGLNANFFNKAWEFVKDDAYMAV